MGLKKALIVGLSIGEEVGTYLLTIYRVEHSMTFWVGY